MGRVSGGEGGMGEGGVLDVRGMFISAPIFGDENYQLEYRWEDWICRTVLLNA